MEENRRHDFDNCRVTVEERERKRERERERDAVGEVDRQTDRQTDRALGCGGHCS